MSEPTVRLVRAGAVAEIILARPERGNALNAALMDELARAFAEVDAASEIRAVLLRGDGPSFCTGLDLTAAPKDFAPILQGRGAAGRQELLTLIRRLQAQVGAPATCAKPVVAAIHGWCLGGGLDLAAAADLRLCSADARFSLREAKVAMVADLGSLQRLPRIIGDAATRELALTAKDIDPQRALALGLVSQVLPDREALLEAARAEAEAIAAHSPLVTQGVKRVLNAQDGMSVQRALEQVALWNAAFLQSDDLTEAFTAFTQRREPVYRGR
ncbi:MAG: crotonase/enoyl-CoA hydratase family protein [Deltaproteobacteria bacterium]|nr:crotonase/enoyl-CoA hydratase family protein [Deltaproteobacteria bacterium]